MDFQQAMRQYRVLRRAYDRRQIPGAAFEKRINEMVVLDEEGQRWMIGVSSGQWYRYDGQKWVKDTPPGTAPIQTAEAENPVETRSKADEEPAASEPEKRDKKKMRKGWIGLLIAVLLIACAAVVITQFMTNLADVPSQILALVQNPTATPTTSPTLPPTITPTQTEPPPTPTVTQPPIDPEKTILGNWTRGESNAFYHFYPDSTFVFYDQKNNLFAAGPYALVDNSLKLDSILGEKIVNTMEYTLSFEKENRMVLAASAAQSVDWTRGEALPWDSRFEDPIAVLFELSFRMDWDAPDPACGFDPTDEESEYRYTCLDFEDGVSITWVDQSPSTGEDRAMERNLFTINIDHQSEETYQGELDYIYTNLQPTDAFHDFETYASSSDLGWFSLDEIAWLDGPWIYSLLRVNAYQSPNPAPDLMLTIETLYEILAGLPPYSSPATMPAEEPDGLFLYSEQIIGTWKQRHQSEEMLTFEEPNAIQVVSAPGDYDYSGIFYFTDDHNVVFELDVGVVYAEISIEGEVMILTINGIDSTYDQIE